MVVRQGPEELPPPPLPSNHYHGVNIYKKYSTYKHFIPPRQAGEEALYIANNHVNPASRHSHFLPQLVAQYVSSLGAVLRVVKVMGPIQPIDVFRPCR